MLFCNSKFRSYDTSTKLPLLMKTLLGIVYSDVV